MLEFVAVVLIFFGGAIFLLAFKSGYQKVGPIVVGALIIALGFKNLPVQKTHEPDIYYRK